MASKRPSGVKTVLNLLLDLLTSGAAAFCFGAHRITVWFKALKPKQRTTVLALTLAALLILTNVLPASGGGGGSSGSSSGSRDRVSTSTRTCLTCMGSGKCDECGGSGYGYVRGSGGDRIKTGCNSCHGSGDCKNPACKNGNVPA